MRIINPSYTGTSPAGITPVRWNTIIAGAQAFFANHPDLPSVDVAQVQALVPELADPVVFQQFLRSLNLSVVG